jgi:osmotically inducible lipoprotein OsmB
MKGEEEMKRSSVFAVIVLTAGSFAMGCANMTSTQQRTLSGGAIGAASGAALGALSGNAGAGAAIGGAAGAAGGYLYEKDQQRRYDR